MKTIACLTLLALILNAGCKYETTHNTGTMFVVLTDNAEAIAKEPALTKAQVFKAGTGTVVQCVVIIRSGEDKSDVSSLLFKHGKVVERNDIVMVNGN